ncbi:MAG: rhodanese-like domain-containing protein [Pseudomonadota bacterium]
MGTDGRPRIGEVSPTEAWAVLRDNPRAVLIDVRTSAEWGFVGKPDLEELGKTLLCVEWATFPGMSTYPHFAEAVMTELGSEAPDTFLFICRSGVRSLRAATAFAELLADRGMQGACFNVAEGFEGDLDDTGHRGVLGGWKARGLAWRQS